MIGNIRCCPHISDSWFDALVSCYILNSSCVDGNSWLVRTLILDPACSCGRNCTIHHISVVLNIGDMWLYILVVGVSTEMYCCLGGEHCETEALQVTALTF